MAPSTGPRNTADFRTSLITAAGVMAGLGCLAVVITGGFITGEAFKKGVDQVPVHAPAPLEFPLTP